MRVLQGAVFHTCDPDHPTTHALAIDEAGTIVALGDEALRLTGHRETLSGFVTPGLIDAHAHLALMARASADIDVSAARNADEVIALLTRQRDGWLVARGLGFELAPAALDAAFPHTPVVVRRVDEHCGVFNSAALGQATWVYEQAFDHAMKRVPQASLAQGVRDAAVHLRSLGITHVHDMATQVDELPLLAGLAVTVTSYLYADTLDTYLHWCANGLPGGRGIKVFLDGALGSRGARLLAPYSDDPCTHGLHYMQGAEQIVEAAAKSAIPVAMHAIGDAAVRQALDLIDQHAPPLPRIEHAQVVDPADLPRFKGRFAGVQFVHHEADLPFTFARLGPRAKNAHNWAALRDNGAILVAGSDAPIADPTPALTLASRRGLSRQEALNAYTVNAAAAAGEARGQLRVGFPAIFTHWKNDPLTAQDPQVQP